MKNQKQKILEILQRGEAITTLEGLTRIGCMTVTQRIYDLRKEGYDIQTKIIASKKGYYAEYFMPAKQPEIDRLIEKYNNCERSFKQNLKR